MRPVVFVLLTSAPAVLAVAPFPRVAVRDGRFIDRDTGATFNPLGVNYYRTGGADGGKTVHAGFCPSFYDRGYVERMMADLEAWGLNTVRTFQLYHVGPEGILTSAQAREINPAYLANVMHFLRAAREHGIHVIFSWDVWLPSSEWWSSRALPGEAGRDLRAWDPAMGINNFRLCRDSLRVRVNGIVTLIEAIGREDPGLLRVVMAWELENEVFFDTVQEPLKSRPAKLAFAGHDYDLADDAQAQAWMDAVIGQWAALGAEAVHRADPEALVGAGLYTFGAVGRQPAQLSRDKTEDSRVPARALALLPALDYADLHLYAWRTEQEDVSQHLARDLASAEWDALRAAAREAGKPVLSGESGVFAHYLRHAPDLQAIDQELGLQCYREQVRGIREAGIAGCLYWHYGNPDSTASDECPAARLFPEYAKELGRVWR